jgi:hypothetical protein
MNKPNARRKVEKLLLGVGAPNKQLQEDRCGCSDG